VKGRAIQWAGFALALALLAAGHALFRMPGPAELAQALQPRHPAEWFVFYFVQPVGFAAIFLAVFAAYQWLQTRVGTRTVIRLPLAGVLVGVALLTVSTDASRAHAAGRSSAVRAEFRRTHPCPSTGRLSGACPGWQIDHIQPLCASGADAVDNLQWLALDDHRAKTRRDVAACRGRALYTR